MQDRSIQITLSWFVFSFDYLYMDSVSILLCVLFPCGAFVVESMLWNVSTFLYLLLLSFLIGLQNEAVFFLYQVTQNVVHLAENYTKYWEIPQVIWKCPSIQFGKKGIEAKTSNRMLEWSLHLPNHKGYSCCLIHSVPFLACAVLVQRPSEVFLR